MKTILISILSSTFLIASTTQAAQVSTLQWKNCAVEVTSVNNSLFEEGLGSIYDMTDDGNSDADSDSVGASVSISGRKTEVRLGQGGWNSQNYQMSSVVEMRDTGGEGEEAVIELEIKDQDDTFLFKLFTQKKIGRVSYKKGRSKNFEHLATFDCSGLKDLRDR